jgi:predicted ATPase
MKLRKIEFRNHEIFEDLQLSFVKEDNSAFETIIFAGENGVGKSLLLDTLFSLVHLPYANNELKKLLGNGSYEFELDNNEVILTFSQYDFFNKDEFLRKFEGLNVVFKINVNTGENQNYSIFNSDSNIFSSSISPTGSIVSNYESAHINKVKGIFSDVEINFKSNTINSVTSQEIDKLRYNDTKIRSVANTSTDIKQLFVDLYTQDNAIISNAAQRNPQLNFDELKGNLDLKLNRFKSAFNQLISNKEMINSQPKNGSHQIIFKDLRNDKEILLDELSSGEKQIIFRASFLLQNQKILDNPVVFIDEPETSLHPDWQIKILNFYKDILTNQATRQLEAQLFIVTHSPFVLHNTAPSVDKVIILERDEQGNIKQKENSKFYNYTSPELIREAFKLPDDIFNMSKNIIYVEGKTDKQYIDKTIQIFGLNTANTVEVHYIGSDSIGGNNGTGESNLKKALEYLSLNHTRQRQKFCLLFDNDDNKALDKKYINLEVPNKVLVRQHLFNENNLVKITRGIENLIEYPKDFDLNKFYKENEIITPNGYGKNKIVTEEILDKQRLADAICQLEDGTLKLVLEKVKQSIEPILLELN